MNSASISSAASSQVDDTRTTLAFAVAEVMKTNAPSAIAAAVVHNKLKYKEAVRLFEKYMIALSSKRLDMIVLSSRRSSPLARCTWRERTFRTSGTATRGALFLKQICWEDMLQTFVLVV